MFRRLYYLDAYATQFEAHVTEQLTIGGRPAVVLDQTYFYPTSGGQPHDTGRLNGTRVVDVTIRPTDGAILHHLSGNLDGDVVQGQIDWERRFDHMQQHTGQHILSQAFVRTAGAKTIGFHLGEEQVTIDLDQAEMTADQLQKVELLANQIIWENRPIQVRMVSSEEAARLPLRKIPAVDSEELRLIEIDDFDLTACGGTHVAGTGAVGLIKIVRSERRSAAARITFLCGRRALIDYDEKNDILTRLANELTTSYRDLSKIVAGLRDEVKTLGRRVKQQQDALLAYEAERFLAAGEPIGKTRVIVASITDKDAGEVRRLAQTLARQPGVISLLGLSGSNSLLVFCRSADAPGEMNALLQPALQQLGSARGGGNATFAQGGGPPANRQEIERALAVAREQLIAQLKPTPPAAMSDR